jgi:hypothetical protein
MRAQKSAPFPGRALDVLARLHLAKKGENLHNFINSLIEDWVILGLLWRAIPPWQPMRSSPTTPHWDYVYPIVLIWVIGSFGGRLLWKARTRRAELMEYYREMQREAWREQARAARGMAPDDRGATTVIGQAIWHQYAAPPEPWSQKPLWSVILTLIVGVVVGLLLLSAEYSFFQVHWPFGRN